jgi:hypothetical protein
MAHRWRSLTHLVNRPKLKLLDDIRVLHSPGSSLFLLVPPLPPVTLRIR